MGEHKLHKLMDAVLRDWGDRGKIIEGGWQAFVIIGGLVDAPEQQKRDMRKAYMLGAQHLFTSIMSILEPGAEPTARDMKRLDLIHQELEAFRRSLGN